MKLLRAFYEFLRDPAVETGLAICGVIIALFSPKEYLILDLSIIATLFTLIVIGQIDRRRHRQAQDSKKTGPEVSPHTVVSSLGRLSRKGAPIISIALIATLAIGVANGILNKDTRIHVSTSPI